MLACLRREKSVFSASGQRNVGDNTVVDRIIDFRKC